MAMSVVDTKQKTHILGNGKTKDILVYYHIDQIE